MKVCSILQENTSILLTTQIVTRVETWMEGKAQQDLSFLWEIHLSYGHPISNR
jgi:urease accessory protein UreH